MMSQHGFQTITMHILHNISQSKSNQTMKFGQLIKYIREIYLFKNYAENEAGRLVPILFSLFEKAYYEVKSSDLQLSFDIF